MSELQKAIDILSSLEVSSISYAPRNGPGLQEFIEALRGVTDYAKLNICTHEHTHRGGILWEICSDCGKSWSDDMDPRPEGPFKYPEVIENALKVLEKFN